MTIEPLGNMIIEMEYSRRKPLLTVSIAAEIIGVHPRTLMIYDKWGFVKPFRTKTNRRLYSLSDIDELKFIQCLTQEKRLNLAGVKLILEALKVSGNHNFDLKQELFPDFKP